MRWRALSDKTEWCVDADNTRERCLWTGESCLFCAEFWRIVKIVSVSGKFFIFDGLQSWAISTVLPKYIYCGVFEIYIYFYTLNNYTGCWTRLEPPDLSLPVNSIVTVRKQLLMKVVPDFFFRLCSYVAFVNSKLDLLIGGRCTMHKRQWF